MADARRRFLALGLAALLTAAGVGFAAPASAVVYVPVAQVRQNQWWLDSFHIKQAWATSKGAGVKVGVLDSGVDGTNQDLTNVVVAGKDFSGQGSPDGQKPVKGDDLGSAYHGTAMAGFIAGRGHGAGHRLGIIGVAPEASIVTASLAFGTSGDASATAALRYLVDQHVKVINMSFGQQEFATKDLAYAQAHDVVLVGAAGNDGRGPDRPANYLGVVDVAGVDKNLTPDPSSSHGGPLIAGGTNLPPEDSSNGVAVVGPYADEPGEGTDLEGDGTNTNGLVILASRTAYTRASGTSNAAAVISGILALIRAAHPEMNAANAINQLGQFAQHPGKTGSNYSGELGFGVPNAYKSVTDVRPTVCENPLGSLAEPQSLGLWKAVSENKLYTPACSGTSSQSPSASPSSGAPSVSSTPNALPPGSSDSSSGVPVWVWPVVAVVVIAAAGAVVAVRRSRRTGPTAS